ncbi:hypothetical protein LguiA_020136 [Lonicera macranthoides]
MGVTRKLMCLIIATFGALCFIFGVIAENKLRRLKLANSKNCSASLPPFVLKHTSGWVAPGDKVVFILQPATGTAITGNCVVLCKHPSDPSVVLGYLSVAFLIVYTVAGGVVVLVNNNRAAVPEPQCPSDHHNMETSCPTAKTGLMG